MGKIRLPLHPKICFCPSLASPSYPASISTVFRLLLLAQGYSVHTTGSVLLPLLNQVQQAPFNRRSIALLSSSTHSGHLRAAPLPSTWIPAGNRRKKTAEESMARVSRGIGKVKSSQKGRDKGEVYGWAELKQRQFT